MTATAKQNAITPETLRASGMFRGYAEKPKPAEKPKRVLTPEQVRRREERKSRLCAVAGRLGGAPLSTTSPEQLRELWRRLKIRRRDGLRESEIFRAVNIHPATARHHLGRARPGSQPSRAMREALRGAKI